MRSILVADAASGRWGRRWFGGIDSISLTHMSSFKELDGIMRISVFSNIITKDNYRCRKRVLSTGSILIGDRFCGLPQNSKGRACLVT